MCLKVLIQRCESLSEPVESISYYVEKDLKLFDSLSQLSQSDYDFFGHHVFILACCIRCFAASCNSVTHLSVCCWAAFKLSADIDHIRGKDNDGTDEYRPFQNFPVEKKRHNRNERETQKVIGSYNNGRR